MDLVKRFSTKANKTAAGGPWFARRAFLSVFIWAFPLLAQDGISLRGKVQGTGGTQLGGAKATLVNEETQAKQETITAEDGSFAFAQVAPGDYLLRVEAKGFEPYRASIQLGTDEPASLKIRLKLQTVEEELIVRPDTSDDRLSPESNTQSMKVDETFFSGLPLAVDYLLPFIETFTYPGARGSEGTSIVVDGIEGGELDMPTSAIRTVKINRNPYSAEFQHPGAGRAEITTKHGRPDGPSQHKCACAAAAGPSIRSDAMVVNGDANSFFELHFHRSFKYEQRSRGTKPTRTRSQRCPAHASRAIDRQCGLFTAT